MGSRKRFEKKEKEKKGKEKRKKKAKEENRSVVRPLVRLVHCALPPGFMRPIRQQ
jgi:hypothetical protein